MSTQAEVSDLRRFPADRGHREHPCKPREDLRQEIRNVVEDLRDRKLVREVDYS